MRLLNQRDARLSPDAEANGLNRENETTTGAFFRKEDGVSACEVRAGCIGRGRAGKTALFRSLSEDQSAISSRPACMSMPAIRARSRR